MQRVQKKRQSFKLWNTRYPEEIVLERSTLVAAILAARPRHSVKLEIGGKKKNLQLTYYPSEGQQNPFFFLAVFHLTISN